MQHQGLKFNRQGLVLSHGAGHSLSCQPYLLHITPLLKEGLKAERILHRVTRLEREGGTMKWRISARDEPNLSNGIHDQTNKHLISEVGSDSL